MGSYSKKYILESDLLLIDSCRVLIFLDPVTFFFLGDYWLDKELKDGIYYTTDDITVDYNKIDEVFISQVNSNVYFTAEARKPVYISHVNGHLQISLCGVKFSGSNGQSVFNITSDAKLTR